MYIMKLFYFLLTVLFVSTTSLSFAQEEKWDGGFFFGAANYMGDLVEPDLFDLSNTNLAFGFMVKRNISQSFGVRFGMTTGKLSSTDLNYDNRLGRGYSFENRLTELSLLAQWEPLASNRYKGGNFNKILSPYIFAGGGLAFSNPETDFNGTSNSDILLDLNTKEKTLVTVPVGIGLKYDITRKWNLGLEIGLRPALSDFLDGMSNAGDPSNDDWYTFGGLTLTTRFGAKDTDGDGITDNDDDCPTIPGISATSGCPDADLDGIADNKDACPNDAGDAKFNGCPDSDGDGVADNQDNCPDTPGIRRFRGCPDTDGDGIADPVDICPTIAGVAALDGCPDADGDGITDADDACPQLAGTESANGCPDADNDGIIDPNDRCPEVAGPAKFGGCPDRDGDGIGDADDACPTNPGPIENDGCPVINEDDQAALDLAMENIRFRTGSNQLLSQSNRTLDEIAEIITRYPNYNLKISGYSDDVGNDAANQSLSERRALACFQYLLVKGISRDRMSYAGYGETNPIETNDTPEGRARNRRVEFDLILR
jgi:OOP family OmpA-OmpF porin